MQLGLYPAPEVQVKYAAEREAPVGRLSGCWMAEWGTIERACRSASSARLVPTWLGLHAVLAIVVACTRTPFDRGGGPKPPWRQRKTVYLEYLRRAGPKERRVAFPDEMGDVRSALAGAADRDAEAD